MFRSQQVETVVYFWFNCFGITQEVAPLAEVMLSPQADLLNFLEVDLQARLEIVVNLLLGRSVLVKLVAVLGQGVAFAVDLGLECA